MIKHIWSLTLEGKPVGVRILTLMGFYYDLDIGVAKKKLGLEPAKLKPLALMEFGGLLMTEEEFATGQIIEDITNNEEVLQEIRGSIKELDPNSPESRQKRNARITDLVQAYYSYMPDAIRRDFAIYHLNNFEGNKNVYEGFSEAQVKLIKDYFRWRTRTLFYEKTSGKVFKLKISKAQKLVDLMGDADDWQYDGAVDTGFLGGSHCELGHALRYEHYATSPSTNKTIVFGVTCISDFFEVDKRVLNEINNAQEVLMKEVKAINFMYTQDKAEKWQETYKDIIWETLKYFKGRGNDNIPNGAGWLYFIGGFHKSGLPLTRSLLYKLNELMGIQSKDMQKDEEARRREELARRKELEEQRRNEKLARISEQQKYQEGVKEAQAQAIDTPALPLLTGKTPIDTILDVCDVLEDAKEKGHLTRNAFGFQVIPTIQRLGRASDRQLKYINDLVNSYNEYIQEPNPMKANTSTPVSTPKSQPIPPPVKTIEVDPSDEDTTPYTGGVQSVPKRNDEYDDIF